MRFPEIMRLRVPIGLGEAVSAAGRRKHCSGPEWLRQVALRALEQEGVFLKVDGQIEQREQSAPWMAPR
jgi:hypothetical protein